MDPVTPAPVVRPQKSKSPRKRPLTKEEEAKRQSVERLHPVTRPRPNFALKRQLMLAQSGGTPLPVAKPISIQLKEVENGSKSADEPLADTTQRSKSSRKRPLTKEEEAKRQSVERLHPVTRPRPDFALKRRLMLAKTEGVALPVTKPIIHGPEGECGEVITPNEPLADTPHAQHASTATQPQLQTPKFKPQSSTLAARTPLQAVAESLSVPQKPVRQDESKVIRQVPQRRDIFDFDDDDQGDEVPRVEEPSISSFQHPSREPAIEPTSIENETLERCLRRAKDIAAAHDNKVRHRGTPPANGSEERSELGAEAGAGPENEGASCVQNEEIDDFDRGFRFGEDEQPLFVPATPPSTRSKRRRTEAQDENPQSYHRQTNDAEEKDENDEEHEAPPLTKRRRSGRKVPAKEAHSKVLQDLTSRRETKSARKPRKDAPKKVPVTKKPRRPPVDELVTVSQRLGSPVFDDSDSPPLELSQDPISPVSESESEDGNHNTYTIVHKVRRQRRKGISPIDVSEFRFPDPVSPRRLRDYLRTPSHSDGFEGKEADPIGRVMPVKGPNFRKETQSKVSVRVRELTLVAERPDSASPSVPPRRRKKQKRQPDTRLEPQPHPSIEQDGQLQAPEEPSPEGVPHEGLQDEAYQNEPQLQEMGEEAEGPTQVIDEAHPDVPHIGAITEEEARPAQVIGRLTAEPNIQPPDPLNSSLQVRRTELAEIYKKSKSNESPDGGVLDFDHECAPIPPITPSFLSDAESSSQRYASTISPSKRKVQKELSADIIVKRSRSIRSTLLFSKADINETTKLSLSRSQPSFDESYRKTPKQEKADMEAMHELSMVSVKRLQSPSNDESDSEENGSDVDSGHHGKEDSPWTAPEEEDEEEDQQEEELATEDNSDMVVEDDSDHESLETEVISEGQFGEVEQNENDPNLLQHDNLLKSSLNNQTATNPVALQNSAMNALELIAGNDTANSLLQLQEGHIQRTVNPLLQGQDGHVQRGDQRVVRAIPRADGSLSRYHEYSDDESYRPSAPMSTALSMEVEDEIHDSPETSPVPVHSRQRYTSQISTSRGRSRFPSGSLTLVRSRQNSPNVIPAGNQNGRQGSIILGESQLPEIPETQFVSEVDRPQSQVYDAPSYFSQAEQVLNQPVRSKSLSRTKSKTGRPNLGLVQGSTELMPASAMFKATISPIKSTPRLPTLTQEVKTPAQSLSALTRKASSGMGTLPASAPRRMMSEPWKPPFMPEDRRRGV